MAHTRLYPCLSDDQLLLLDALQAWRRVLRARYGRDAEREAVIRHARLVADPRVL